MPSSIEKLSTDERYLFEIANAVSTGECSQALSNKLPGPLNHARWNTKASRCLRHYVGTLQPSQKLVDIVTYIMKVYVPTYSNIKLNNSCTNGRKRFFNLLKYSSYLSANYREVIINVCKNNFYFAHPENILLAMIYDDEVKLAVDNINSKNILK